MATGCLPPLETKVCTALETRDWIQERPGIHSLPESPGPRQKPKQEEAGYLISLSLSKLPHTEYD